jgi:hypothetical protein
MPGGAQHAGPMAMYKEQVCTELTVWVSVLVCVCIECMFVGVCCVWVCVRMHVGVSVCVCTRTLLGDSG